MTLAHLSQASVVVVAVILGTHSLKVAQAILLPLVFALFIYSLALPLIDMMQKKWGFPRWGALLTTILGYFFLAALAILFTFSSIRNFSHEAILYKARIQETAVSLETFLTSLGLNMSEFDLSQQISQAQLLDLGRLLTSNILDLLSFVAFVSIYLIFLFMGKGRSEQWPRVFIDIQSGVSRYIWVKTLMSFLTASLVGIILWSFGVEMTLLFIMLTFALNFIPSVGSIVAVLLPLPILWLQFSFSAPFWTVLPLIAAVQIVVGNILEPKMLGKSLDLHPVTVMFFLVFWAFVWGVMGAFLSIPLTVILKLFLEKMPATKPFSALMSGRFEFTSNVR
jgi:AI-2 transport protein TqsA